MDTSHLSPVVLHAGAQWALYPFYEASYILFIFTLSVNVKYANNRIHKFRSVVSRGKSLATVNFAFFLKKKKYVDRGNLLNIIASYFLRIGLLFEV